MNEVRKVGGPSKGQNNLLSPVVNGNKGLGIRPIGRVREDGDEEDVGFKDLAGVTGPSLKTA